MVTVTRDKTGTRIRTKGSKGKVRPKARIRVLPVLGEVGDVEIPTPEVTMLEEGTLPITTAVETGSREIVRETKWG